MNEFVLYLFAGKIITLVYLFNYCILYSTNINLYFRNIAVNLKVLYLKRESNKIVFF